MSERLKVALLYGGNSSEHEISLISAASVLKNLESQKYEVFPIGIDKQGLLFLNQEAELRAFETALPVKTTKSQAIESLIKDAQFFIPIDVVIPMLHGSNYEDGCIQGLLKLAHVAYVGCDVLSSSIGMDKDMTRRIACTDGIESTRYALIQKSMSDNLWNDIVDQAISQFGFPLFVKPCSLGSSVAIHKTYNKQQVFDAIQDAFRYDSEVLIEAFVSGREIEVAVLEDAKQREILTSVPGEIRVNHPNGFYSYDAKYIDSNSSEYLIPAPLSVEWTLKIREAAKSIFKKLKCKGMARVDFFFDEQQQKLYFNEINTIPGFTSISLYPSMWKHTGINFPELLDSLIESAIVQYQMIRNLVTDYRT
jgi:D-alanine-D-alanine ligase